MLNANQMQQPIIFFDGACNLCNGFVDWLIRHAPNGSFFIASLQGETAKKLLPPSDQQNLESVIFYQDGKILVRAAAVGQILALLPPPWRWFSVLCLLPGFIIDPLYQWVAKNRYVWFGRRASCRVPTDAERLRFLP